MFSTTRRKDTNKFKIQDSKFKIILELNVLMPNIFEHYRGAKKGKRIFCTPPIDCEL